MRRVLLLGALAALAVGCGSASASSSQTAGTFMVHVLKEEISGQWAAQWGDLHPGHQRLITRAQYVLCSESLATNVGTGKERFVVRAVRDQAIHVRGIPERTAKLVTIELDSPGAAATTYRLHAVRDSGRWTWILGATFLDALAHHRCLDGSPLSPAH